MTDTGTDAHERHLLFERSWWAFVERWFPANEAERTRLLDAALADGLPPGPDDQGEPDPAWDLACSVAAVKRAGAMDLPAYITAHSASRTIAKSPVKTFCERGWRERYNPRGDFDLWWYWNEYLDPTRTTVNPLLHHLFEGRRAGLATVPALVPDRPATALATDRPVRRACLFAAYDPDGIVDDYVVAFVSELARHSDVFYLADSTMLPGELEKLAGVTQGAWSIRHSLYDFGSWSMLARDLVGWDVLAGYDEVLFVNDSSYLLRPLDDLFARMDATAADWWGLQPTKRPYSRDLGDTEPMPMAEAWRRWSRELELHPVDQLHLSSYFLAFRAPVIADPGFRHRLDTVARQDTKQRVINTYEIGLSRYLMTAGFVAGAAIDLYPYIPVYTSDYWTLLDHGFWLLKRNLLSDNFRRMPDLDQWKERVLAAVPAADVDSFEKNLLRVSRLDTRQRGFAVRSRGDGTVDYRDPLAWERFRIEDRYAPKFDHWWAFPVCAYNHTLAGNERAVFEEVRHDPSIKKIILTRSVPVDLPGENVVTIPLVSREGQYHLLRSRQIFVKHGPRQNAYWPLSPIAHNFINLWHGIPLKRFGSAVTFPSKAMERVALREHGGSRAVVTSSPIDSLMMANAFWPMGYPDMWPTGLPRNDYITCPPDRLPDDLREQEDRLRAEMDGRRLVMFLPTFKDAQADAYYRFEDDELARLAAWAERHHAVLGVREHMSDQARTYWHQLASLGSIDLSSRRFPDLEVLYRSASALISDYSSCLVDFTLTGRPVISFAYDFDRYTQHERGLFYDLEQVLPGPVCRDFGSFATALDTVFDEPTADEREDYEWRRRIFFEHTDDQSAARVVRRVKDLAGPRGPVPSLSRSRA